MEGTCKSQLVDAPLRTISTIVRRCPGDMGKVRRTESVRRVFTKNAQRKSLKVNSSSNCHLEKSRWRIFFSRFAARVTWNSRTCKSQLVDAPPRTISTIVRQFPEDLGKTCRTEKCPTYIRNSSAKSQLVMAEPKPSPSKHKPNQSKPKPNPSKSGAIQLEQPWRCETPRSRLVRMPHSRSSKETVAKSPCLPRLELHVGGVSAGRRQLCCAGALLFLSSSLEEE